MSRTNQSFHEERRKSWSGQIKGCSTSQKNWRRSKIFKGLFLSSRFNPSRSHQVCERFYAVPLRSSLCLNAFYHTLHLFPARTAFSLLHHHGSCQAKHRIHQHFEVIHRLEKKKRKQTFKRNTTSKPKLLVSAGRAM